MTDTQRHDACEAMFVVGIFNERLNTALKNDTQASLSGDAAIATFVQLLYSKLTFKLYKEAVEALADQLGINLSAPPAPVPEPAPAPAPVPVEQTPEPSPVPTPAPQPAPSGDLSVQQVVAALAALNIHVRKNKLTVGMLPIDNDASGIQIGGDAAACILGMSNANADGTPRGSDGQNPGEAHINTFVVADNDGGIRWRQYLQWVVDATGRVVRKRNTSNRRASILALDSAGDLCKSTLEVGASSDGGQSWYIRTNGNIVEFCTYKVGAAIRILKSLFQYSDTAQKSWTNE